MDLGDQEGDAEYDYIISHDMLIQSFLKELNADAETFHSLAGLRDKAAANGNPNQHEDAAIERFKLWTMEAIALGWLDLELAPAG